VPRQPTSGSKSRQPWGGLTVGSGPLMTAEQEDVSKLLRLLRQLAKNDDEGKGPLEPLAFQSRLATFSVGARVRFNDALMALASQVQDQPHDKAFLVRLAEHMAIRLAVDTYERGDSEINGVQSLLERMGKEIAALRDILAGHETKLKDAGIAVESHTDQLDQQFWTAMPDTTKRSLLLSAKAWYVPPRHLRDYLGEQQELGDNDARRQILSSYLKGVENENVEAQRKTFSGLCELAECYGDEDALLGEAITRVGGRLSLEQDRELRSLASAAFVRLSQEGATRRSYPALVHVLNLLEQLESMAPTLIAGLHQRIGLEDRILEFLEDGLREHKVPTGLIEILQRLPRSVAKQLAKRFGQAHFREDCDLLLTLFHTLGPEGIAYLKDSLNDAPPLEAVESVGLLSRIDPALLTKALPLRLRECPRSIHDQVVRRIAFSGAPERGQLLASLFDSLDPLIRPLALDEMGMSGDAGVVPWLLKVAETEKCENELVRLKAIEAIGRLRVKNVVPILRRILEAKHVFRWLYPSEVRIVAAQTLAKIDPGAWQKLSARAELTPTQLSFPALDMEADASGVRQRRYRRSKLTQPLIAVTTNLRENLTLEVHSLNLGGGAATIERHFPAGIILALKFTFGLRSVRTQALVRESPAGAVNFEIVEISLADRSRLRQILAEVGCTPPPGSAKNRVRRRLPPRSKH
jgi:HEAT repeats